MDETREPYTPDLSLHESLYVPLCETAGQPTTLSASAAATASGASLAAGSVAAGASPSVAASGARQFCFVQGWKPTNGQNFMKIPVARAGGRRGERAKNQKVEKSAQRRDPT